MVERLNDLIIRLEVLEQKIKYIIENGLIKEQNKIKDDVECLKASIMETSAAIEKINQQLNIQFRLIIVLLSSVIGLFLATVLRPYK